MTLYSNFFSNAIESVETKENQVLITYSSNIGKEYAYNCEDVPSFTNNLCSVLISNELQLDDSPDHARLSDDASVGRYIQQCRKDNVLVDQ